jgi:hypothetical protein
LDYSERFHALSQPLEVASPWDADVPDALAFDHDLELSSIPW